MVDFKSGFLLIAELHSAILKLPEYQRCTASERRITLSTMLAEDLRKSYQPRGRPERKPETVTDGPKSKRRWDDAHLR